MRWKLHSEPSPDQFRRMADFGPILTRILRNRNIERPAEADEFLHHRYSKARDPYLLMDMDRAIDRIKKAIDGEEIIVVYGDFDADGVSATVLLTEALRNLGLDRRQVQPYIPDRVDEGYGLNEDALAALHNRGASLVVTVDCGIRSIREADYAADLGLDMIITDHHNLGSRVPLAAAIINPKRSDSPYPESKLAGVGVAYKVAQALRAALPERARFDDQDLLDLVALGTITDLVPLLGENRILVAEGLAILNSCQRPGIDALARVSGLQQNSITAESIAFALGPRINAAGRIAHAYDAAKLLAASDRGQADEQAQKLNHLNRERQSITRRYTEMAEQEVDLNQPLLIIENPEFHSGVVGLVASALTEKYYRPTIVMEHGPEESRGSCRSIPEFHITAALDQVAELLERHGGHDMAAGFTINNQNLPEFRSRIRAIADEELPLDELAPTLDIDAELALADVDWSLYGFLEQLEPTGIENEVPVFVSRGVEVQGTRAVGKGGSHLQLWVGGRHSRFKAIAFRQGQLASKLPERVDIAYTISKDDWNGRNDLQLIVKDIHEPEIPGNLGGEGK